MFSGNNKYENIYNLTLYINIVNKFNHINLIAAKKNLLSTTKCLFLLLCSENLYQ